MTALGHVPGPTGGTADPQTASDSGRERRGFTGYLLMVPGTVWLLLFFLVPLVTLLSSSLYDPSGSFATGYSMTWHFANYTDALSEYGSTFVRSFVYAFIATVACLLLGFPLAYAIALKAGRWRNLMLMAVIAPFFTSFLLRTLSWKLLLGDDSWAVNALQALPLVPDDLRLLATPAAVITGLTYNFLPFMVLPLYASLEKLDPRLLEAGADLYAHPFTAFRRITLPLSMPGLVAGTLLTFIPAAGDYINAQLLGTPRQYMIGNVIDNLFLVQLDYPAAAACSVVLMAVIVAMVLVYVRRSGTEELL
jgi:spermidine/putrescine transport system permease protein